MKTKARYKHLRKHDKNNQIFTALLTAFLLTATLGSLITATVPVGAVVVIDTELTVLIDPEGAGNVNPDQRIFTSGTSITLIATANEGYTFSHWSGDIPSEADDTNPSLTLLMDEDKTITAHFEEDIPDIEYCSSGTKVVYFDQGLEKNGNPVDASRSDETKALGIPENLDQPPINFVSLGYGGTLILECNPYIGDGPGDDFTVFETSYSNPPCDGWPEHIHVYVSQNNHTWYHIGEICLDESASFDLSSIELTWARYVKLVDNTNTEDFNAGNTDGYDVDGIGVINCIEIMPCEPLILLPEESILMYSWEEPIEWSTMFKNELANIYGEYQIMNGTYPAWCVDYGTNIPEGYENPLNVSLYNSYTPPDHLTHENWHKINYILNHKQGTRYDVQRAIWYFVNFGEWEWNYTGYMDEPVTDSVYDMIDDANENSHLWCPECGDTIAVINDPGIEHEFQITIIEAILCEINPIDNDEDDDGVPDDEDKCPGHDDNLDLDEDGIPDGCDDDIDGDGYPNDEDCNPTNPDRWRIGLFYWDGDGDGYHKVVNHSVEDGMIRFCYGEPDPEYTLETLGPDCNDFNPNVHPGAEELCDEIDNDCDGLIDEGCGEEEDDDDDDDETPIEDDDDEDEENEDEEEENNEDEQEPVIVKKTSSRPRRSVQKIPNNAPTAVISEPFEYTVDDQPITFDGSKSSDPDDHDFIMKYYWNLGDGTKRLGKTVTHEYKHPGTYYVTLTVFDSLGAKDSISTKIIVEQPNRAPIKPLIGGILDVNAEEAYSFAASSTDPDGDDIEYAFDWGDGASDESGFLSLPSGSAYSLLHTWMEPGDYTLTVTVTDGELSSSSSIAITVNPAPLSAELLSGILIGLFAVIFLIIFFILRRYHPKPTEQ